MFSKIRLILLIALLAMFTPLSMDIYLPALPQMLKFFDSTAIVLNSTLYLFFLLMAVGMLCFGPLSDKYGRRAILIPCSIIYCLASICCALSTTITMLICSRAIQALCVGAFIMVSTALAKDAFDGKQRDVILGVSQAMSLVAPVVAPLIGAFLLQFFPWQASFILLTIFGALVLILSITQKETLAPDNRLDVHVFAAWKNLGVVLKDKGFTRFMIVSSISPAGYMAFISASSYIYQNYFGLTEMEFGYYYAVNATLTVIASLAFIKLTSVFKSKTLITICLLMIGLSGVLTMSVGVLAPLVFLISFLPCAFFCTVLRPLSTSILLRQQENNAGSASALLNFTQTILSCLGLVLGSLAWSNIVFGLGTIVVLTSAAGISGWLILIKSKTPIVSMQ